MAFVNSFKDLEVYKLSRELASLTEVAYDCGYISLEQENLLLEKCITINHMLNSMINKADLFCKQAP